jgi:UDP-3-O-[3-hydroxymyristoyl] N-acetylglucosamine deacetylase
MQATKILKQRTIENVVNLSGIALHSGKPVNLRFIPAEANSGIQVLRTDLPNSEPISLKASQVFETKLATKVGHPNCFVSTVEHFMAAAYALGVDNLKIEISGSEFPILDGSSLPFLVALSSANIIELSEYKNVFILQKEIEVIDPKDPSRFIRAIPSKTPKLSYSIDFSKSSSFIGNQFLSMILNGNSFLENLSFARTFCLQEEVQYMHSIGLAQGGSLDNAVVVEKTAGVLNANGLRMEREFVRHKMLDCVGDLALVGVPVLAEFIAHKAGHDLHTQIAQKLEVLVAESAQTQKLFSIRSAIFGTQNFDSLFQFPKSFQPQSLAHQNMVVG